MLGLPNIPYVQLIVNQSGALIVHLIDHEKLAVQQYGQWLAGLGINKELKRD